MFSVMALKQNYEISQTIDSFFSQRKVCIRHSSLFTAFGAGAVETDLETGKVVRKIGESRDAEESGSSEYTCVAVVGQSLVVALKNLVLKQWSFTNESWSQTWKSLHRGPITCMVSGTRQFAEKSSSLRLVTGAADGGVRVWDLENASCTHSIRCLADGVITQMEFVPRTVQPLLVVCTSMGRVFVYDLAQTGGRQVARLECHTSAVTTCVFDAQGSQLFCGGRDQIISVWTVDTWKHVKSIPVFDSIESLCLLDTTSIDPGLHQAWLKLVSTDDVLLMAGGEQGVLKIWNASQGRLLLELSGFHGGISQVVTTQTSVIVVTENHDIQVLSRETLKRSRHLIGLNDEILALKFASNGSHLAAACNSADLRLYTLESMSCDVAKGHKDTILSVDVSPVDSSLIATSSKDNDIRLWRLNNDTNTISCVAHASGHTSAVTGVKFARRSTKLLVSIGKDLTLKAWHLPGEFQGVEHLNTLATVVAHNKELTCVDVSPNDQVLATGSMEKAVKVWSLTSTGKHGSLELLRSLTGHQRGIWSLSFSPVDQVLATSSGDMSVKIFALSDGSCVRTFQGHASAVLQVHFVSRGLQLLSADSGGLVKLWTIKTNVCVKTWDEHHGKLWALDVLRDGEIFASGGSDSKILIWQDVTDRDMETERSQEETMLDQEQQLANVLHEKDFARALSLAVTLDRPATALTAIKQLLQSVTVRDGDDCALERVVAGMNDACQQSLLRFAVEWNTNSRHCHAAHAVLNTIFRLHTPEEILKFPGARSMIESFIPYSERHFERLTKLRQNSCFLNRMV